MKSSLIGLIALSVTALGTPAWAQGSTTIIDSESGTVVTRPARPPTVIDRPLADEPPTTGAIAPATPPGCASTVTRQDAPDGTSTTVRKERCNPD